MTKDQKQVLKAIVIFVGFKAALYAAICYAAKISAELAREEVAEI